MAERTVREQILLLVAFAVIVGMGYYMLRYRPMSTEIAMADAKRAESEKGLSEVKWPAPTGEEATTLETELAETDRNIKTEQREVVRLQRQSPPTDEDLRQLNVEIARLAEYSGVVLNEHKPYNVAGSGLAIASTEDRTALPAEYVQMIRKQSTSSNPLEIVTLPGPFIDVKSIGVVSPWELERITVVGTFTALHKFIDGLQNTDPKRPGLPWRVTVVQLEIDADKAKDSRQPLLKATMVVGM